MQDVESPERGKDNPSANGLPGLVGPALVSAPCFFSLLCFGGFSGGPAREKWRGASLAAGVLGRVRKQGGNAPPPLDQVSRAIAAARRAGARSPSPALQGGAPGPRSALGWFFGLFQTLRPVRTRRIEAEASSCKTDG